MPMLPLQSGKRVDLGIGLHPSEKRRRRRQGKKWKKKVRRK